MRRLDRGAGWRRLLHGSAGRVPGGSGSLSGRHYDRSAFNGWTGNEASGAKAPCWGTAKPVPPCPRKHGPGDRKAAKWSAGRRARIARRARTPKVRSDRAPPGAPSPRTQSSDGIPSREQEVLFESKFTRRPSRVPTGPRDAASRGGGEIERLPLAFKESASGYPNAASCEADLCLRKKVSRSHCIEGRKSRPASCAARAKSTRSW